MTNVLTHCVFCGFFHVEDYSDVMDTPQDWIIAICKQAKADAMARHTQARRLQGGTREERREMVAGTGSPAATPINPQGQAVRGYQDAPTPPDRGQHHQAGGSQVVPQVVHVKFKRIHGHAGTPSQAYRGDAGYDLELSEGATLPPGQWQNLKTGIVAAIPEGYWGHILARSSTWRHHGIRVEPAVIDCSYRGELMIYAVNTKKEPQEVKMGQRLAQIIVVPLPNVEWLEQMDLPPGERGERGYGSSGGQG